MGTNPPVRRTGKHSLGEETGRVRYLSRGEGQRAWEKRQWLEQGDRRESLLQPMGMC